MAGEINHVGGYTIEATHANHGTVEHMRPSGIEVAFDGMETDI